MKIILILDNIRSVHNVGSIFRTADCMGVSEVLLCGTTPTPIDRFGRPRSDLAKIALGAESTMPWKYYTTTTSVITDLQSKEIPVFALEQSPQSINLFDWRVPEKFSTVALVVGYEVSGVDAGVLSVCDGILEIPQWGVKESLNVSVATGIALACIRAQKNRI